MLGMTPIGAARTRSAYELTARCTARPGPARSGAFSSLLIAVHTLDRERFWRVWVSARRRMQHAERPHRTASAMRARFARASKARPVLNIRPIAIPNNKLFHTCTGSPTYLSRTAQAGGAARPPKAAHRAGLCGGAAPQVSGSLKAGSAIIWCFPYCWGGAPDAREANRSVLPGAPGCRASRLQTTPWGRAKP
jgi:hypothetical protein